MDGTEDDNNGNDNHAIDDDIDLDNHAADDDISGDEVDYE